MNVNANTDAYNADPVQWGPHVWATMHTLALRADSLQTIDSFYMFINALQSLLPCETCKDDYVKWLKLNNRPSVGKAFEWSVQLHNYVNSKLQKPQLSLESAKAAWLMSKCSYSCEKSTAIRTNTHMSLLLILFLTATIVILIIFR